MLICHKIESKAQVKLTGNKFKIEKISRVAAVIIMIVDRLYPFVDSKRTNFRLEPVSLILKATPQCNSYLQKPTFQQNPHYVKSKMTL